MKYYHEQSITKHGANTKELNIDFQKPIIVGKFIDRERPTFLDAMNQRFSTVLGNRYAPYGITQQTQPKGENNV
jgi:2-oxoglutarate ferredoxin oxidoreductase subunit beta